KGLVIQVELELQRPIGDPTALGEEILDLVKHVIEVHQYSSTWASAASVWGSQKVISIPRYISTAVASSARACSRWPIAAYSVPRPRWQCAWSGRMPSASARARASR